MLELDRLSAMFRVGTLQTPENEIEKETFPSWNTSTQQFNLTIYTYIIFRNNSSVLLRLYGASEQFYNVLQMWGRGGTTWQKKKKNRE